MEHDMEAEAEKPVRGGEEWIGEIGLTKACVLHFDSVPLKS